MKLSTKLFLVFLGLTTVMLLMAMGLARYSFQLGFLEFVGGMGKARLQNIAQELVLEYENNDDEWRWLNQQEFNNIIQLKPKRLARNMGSSRQISSSRPYRDNSAHIDRPSPPRRGRADYTGEGLQKPDVGPSHEESNFPKGPATGVFDQTGKF